MLIDDESLSAEEKIKQLVEFEKDKRRELDEKRAELEKKKKELERLEQQGRKEIEDARKEIEEKIEELAVEEKQRFEELEELRRRREAEAASLEETIAEEEREGRITEIPEQREYGEVIEEILRGTPGFYSITNYNVLNRLENITREAAQRPLTPSERSFIDNVQYHAERMQRNEFYKDKDTSEYMRRELEQIDRIKRIIREEREKPGDYRP